ncbi:hypothetical protein Aca07nite_86940 [Actinoplanes capillaceus]|uniref:Zinc finger DksA/TraR C4-type domain-containing protein n=1 Tax=Actinoplanes campanulatus TaxID=113559 RepID=A0ABQ3WZ03_9ACTN|nr:TraR/DksA C4-type zinc finger protein [Actinoplanes capillaceus]GID51419.1 hypothetical protein Aca07nite_86940 [Actinoplanes capillaceus]
MTTALHPSTAADPASMKLLRSMLEEAFALHTNRLMELTVCGRLPGHGGYDARTLEILVTDHRQRVADTAHALQRMAEGTYGTCQTCRRPIPLGRLRTVPHGDRCARCQRHESH